MQNFNKVRPSGIQRKRGQSIGPKFKINVPIFQFEQAVHEEKIVDNILEAHRQNKLDIDKLGKDIKNSERLPIIQQKQQHKKIYGNYDQLKFSYNKANGEVDLEKLTQQAALTFGTKQNKNKHQSSKNNIKNSQKIIQMTQNSVDISLENSQQNLQKSSQTIQVKRQKRGISDYQGYNNKNQVQNRNFFYQQQNQIENQIIFDKELNQISKTNAIDVHNPKNPINQSYLIKQQNSLNLRDSPQTKRQININNSKRQKITQSQLDYLYMQKQQQNQQIGSDQNLVQKQINQAQKLLPIKNFVSGHNINSQNSFLNEHDKYKQKQLENNFQEKGHNCQKTLQQFDLFEDQKTPQEWVKFYENKKPPHAQCPIYINKQYLWTDVQVLSYNDITQKYTVKILLNQALKKVVRLSLIFKDEEKAQFMHRVNEAKILQMQAEENNKFYNFVDALPDTLATPMSKSQKNQIKKKILSIQNFFYPKNKDPNLVEKLTQNHKSEYQKKLKNQRINEIFEQVEFEYVLFQKKHKVLHEMQFQENDEFYKQNHIKDQFQPKQIQQFGRTEHTNYNIKHHQDKIKSQLIIFENQKIIETLASVQKRLDQLKNTPLFQYEYQKPVDLTTFKANQNRFHRNAITTLNIYFKEYVINEISDNLSKVFNFLESSMQAYKQSSLVKFIYLIDKISNNFMRQTYLNNNVQMYTDFIKQFCRPDKNSQHLNGLWKIQSEPLLVIDLIADKDFKVEDQKKLQKMEKEKEKEKLKQFLTAKKDLNQNQPDINQQQQQQIQSENVDLQEDEKQENLQINQQPKNKEPIFFSPSLKEIEEAILRPLEQIVESSLSFQNLQSDLVPLIEDTSLNKYIFEIKKDNAIIQQGKAKIQEFLLQCLQEPEEILEKFQKFSYFFTTSCKRQIRKIFYNQDKKQIPIMDLKPKAILSQLDQFQEAQFQIQKFTSTNNFKSQLLLINTKQAKQVLVEKCQEFIQAILKKIDDICGDSCQKILLQYQEIEQKLKIIPKDEKQWVQLQTALNENQVNLQQLQLEILQIVEFISILDKYCYAFDQKKEFIFWDLKSRPVEILALVNDAKLVASKYEEKFMEKLDQEKSDFTLELKEIQSELLKVKQFQDYSKVNQYAQIAMALQERINKAQSTIANFNEREQIFKQILSEYPEILKIKEQFEPYFQLWEIAIDFSVDDDNWRNGPLLKNNYQQIEKKINQYYYKQVLQLIKVFNQQLEDFDTADVAKKLIHDLDKFKEVMWMIEFLTTESLSSIKKSAMHWNELFTRCNVESLQLNEDLTLNNLLENGLQNHRDIIEEISNKADKQWGIEKRIKEMEEKAKSVQIELLPFKQTNSYILKPPDELFQLFDDQLNVLLMLKASPFVKPLLKQAQALEQRIILIIDTLDECLRCQRSWIYLEPIFSADDIFKKLPDEKRQFDRVDGYWRDLMLQFEKDLRVWENVDSEKLRNDLRASNRTLDAVQKSLSEYLETKRRYFPRFYFLSDEELLEILADTKDPLKVQKHIGKCFEAIQEIDFQEGKVVRGMISSEKENIQFDSFIDVTDGQRKGNVEIWLSEIEQLMIKTLKSKTQQCMEDKQERNQWLQNWPGQLILAVDMIRWTNTTEVTILNQNNPFEHVSDWNGQTFKNLGYFRKELEQQLQNVVQLVRQDLTPLTRMTLGALVTLNVHSKDVIQDLEKKQVSSLQDFSWISQLRYEQQETKKDLKSLQVKMINANIKYGFEYLGNSPRLVITPLTDRCYRTLMGAKHLQYGGAPEGPAGTGKTETVKDLAKALAVQCVVFNCSDGLNYLAMRKFFKGLASSGAWCCFDEFNRIDLEVLSVIAQQVLTIQEAIKSQKKQFIFDDEEIPLILSCAVNITMNPGYAGRSELPDNLKALFRPCAMMVPDYAMISEIYLYSVGFTAARSLAKKVVASLRLSSEQLSSQDHYDFGMRAVKAILTAAGNLKRKMLAESEEIVCLKALMNVNLPKFTINDVPLFMSITSDLFPNVQIENTNYGFLEDGLKQACIKQNLQPLDNFLTKCVQLYDTINVRHGLMIVGQAFSGKSCILKTLSLALSQLSMEDSLFKKVSVKSLNPKAVTSDQLFGKLDPNTKSWSDGIVALLMRQCANSDKKNERHWIVFDGPVDAIWIENMNTVLDDNKKLCLTSGEIIKMTSQMTMMFEVADLAEASPATVSRCGMVFLETQSLGFNVLIQSFIQNLPENLFTFSERIQTLLQWSVNATLAWCQKYAHFPVHNSFMAMVSTALKYLSIYTEKYREQEGLETLKCTRDTFEDLENYILFCVIWSIGAAIDNESRIKFNEFMHHLVSGSPDLVERYQINFFLNFPYTPLCLKETIPENASFFSYLYDIEQRKWIQWVKVQPPYQITPGGHFHEIFIPTQDSIRNTFFLNLSAQNNQHILFCGPTGTGKTSSISLEIKKNYLTATSTYMATAFSGKTTQNQLQQLIESKVSSRRRKGVFGPEEGKKNILIFIDDLNMPQKDLYGSQPPIELLRQWMDTGSFYDLETKQIKKLIGMTFVSAMLPSGNQITLRFLRHFNTFYVSPFDKFSLTKIFSSILDWYFLSQPVSPSLSIKELQPKLVNSTINLYEQIQKQQQLLPTPHKSHYLYNLRDLSKVFQGICLASHNSYKTPEDLISLWIHECQRVFRDRLINLQDQQIFDSLQKQILISNFQKGYEQIVKQEPLLWANFVPNSDIFQKNKNDLQSLKKSQINEKNQVNLKNSLKNGAYCEVKDLHLLSQKTNEYLEEYNQVYTSNRMNLVLFMSAIQHVIKIVRVMEIQFGHSLLVGVGGSGRKSLATLSSFISTSSEPLQIDQESWIDELQRVVKQAGLEKQKPCMFLFSDTQINDENNLEQICNLLNTGEIPNLFNQEDKAKLLEDIQFQGTPTEKINHFLSQCKQNLHVVLAFSPVGDKFRTRLRNFPALVNCTTIDWFLAWPEEALKSTASNFFQNEMKIQEENLINGLQDICVDMQTRISNLTIRYKDELRRFYYVTPTSYLELLQTLKKLVDSKNKNMSQQIKRYVIGVQKIVDTEKEVEKMQQQLEQLQPILKEKTHQNQELLKKLQTQQKEADKNKQICEIDQQKCNEQRDEANHIREECQQQLNKVIPLLDEAAKALERITKEDMNTLRSFVKPPESAAVVMEGLCYVFNEDQKVKVVSNPENPKEKHQDFWDYAKKKLLNDKLRKRVLDFREESIRNIPKAKIDKLSKFIENPLFEKEKVFNGSKAAGNLSLWIRAVINTYYALQIVDPKKEELKQAEQSLLNAENVLNEKKLALQNILDQLEILKAEFDSAQKEQQQLKQKVEKTQQQLDRAGKLITGLAQEKKSWSEKAAAFEKQLVTVIGDCLLSSAIIAYLGAFPIAYREEMIAIWKKLLYEKQIQFSENFSIQNILSNPIQIGQWTQAQKLPNDSFSIDNAIILKNSNRFPLMIDPQSQANNWVKKLEQNRNLTILRPTLSEKEIILKLEQCVQLGLPVLLENVTENIDPIFEPILLKKIILFGGSYKIKFREKLLNYSKDFQFYMTTKYTNPHYSPEICVKVTLLNFQVTVEGLEDQMLNIIVQQQEPMKDKQRQQNIEDFFKFKEQQQNTEDLILKLLNDSQGNLLEDDQLINTLETSKRESKEIEEALIQQGHFKCIIDQIREFYREVAIRVANMYFVILDLSYIEPTYQWSLEFYIAIFMKAIQNAQTTKDLIVNNIINQFMVFLYENICRSLLEKDKLIFSFLLTLRILQVEQKISQKEIRFIMQGSQFQDISYKNIPEKAKKWVSKTAWSSLLELEQINPEIYKNFSQNFLKDLQAWEDLFHDPQNYKKDFPKSCGNLQYYHKLTIIKILFADKFVPAVTHLVQEILGAYFINPPPFNLDSSIKDSTAFTPLIFVLSSGADPRIEIQAKAQIYYKDQKFTQISLGQGQGELAEKAIKLAIQEGNWILLQNCHLAPSFMPELEKILEKMEQNPEQVHEEFRIWLTTMPSSIFPPSILNKSIKMTFEPPRGIRNNLLRSYNGIDPKYFENSQKPEEWKKLLFGLSFFHALILERREFGPLGWNIPYEFTIADFTISYSQLKLFLDQHEEIPWEALNYMVAEANYGGRVTDPIDRRLINIILEDFYNPQILDDNYKFTNSSTYFSPNFQTMEEYIEFIEQLPLDEDTEIFGLHSNAAITSHLIQTNKICDTILGLLPRETSTTGQKPEEMILEKITHMKSKLPPLFDIDLVQKQHPVKYQESLNTVLQQEIIRYNKLLKLIQQTLEELSKAIKGLSVMSPDLETLFNNIFDNKIPEIWIKISYPSLKPLGSYLNDLIERLNYMQKWINEGPPNNFWISGFFFTQSFLTGILQNYARKYKLPIDTLQYKYEVINKNDKKIDVNQKPNDGCYIYGLFLDGARWDEKENALEEQLPKQLYSNIPFIYLLPTDQKTHEQPQQQIYECPVYKTTQRRGTLSTTGHSTNFVLSINLKIKQQHTAEHWVKRGVALVTQITE